MTGASCDEGHPQIAPLKCFCAKCQKYLFYLNSNIVDAVIFFLKAGRKACFFYGGAVVNFLLRAYSIIVVAGCQWLWL